MEVNNLAIALTRLIERDLVVQFFERKESPSFFNIRLTIKATLETYIKVFGITNSSSPMMLERMTEEMRKGYFEHEKRKCAAELGNAVMEADMASYWTYKNEHSLIENRHYAFAILDGKKIKHDAELVQEERRMGGTEP